MSKLREFLETFRAKNWVLDLMMIGYSALVAQVTFWFEALTEPTAAQAAFVAAVYGILSILAGTYGRVRAPGSDQ